MRHAIVALLCASPLVLAAPTPAHAACTGSQVVIIAHGGLDQFTATWHFTPPCDVVETGLLIGQDPGTLAPVGAPIYSPQGIYSVSVPVEGDRGLLGGRLRDG